MQALIIDDSKVMRSLLRSILDRAGFEVTEAENGLIGLTRLQQQALPDVVLVDWNMPEMDGIAFLLAARANPAWRALPILMVTTENEASRVARAQAAGASAYVTKPFTRERILEKLALLGFSQTPAAACPPPTKEVTMRALVVDDARVMRMLLKQALQKCGVEVVEARNGQEGMAQLAQPPAPDVALVDCNMPDMNGPEFVRAVRADPRFRDLPLIVVTGEERGGLLQQAMDAGANDFVTKPFSMEVIREKLQRVGLTLSNP